MADEDAASVFKATVELVDKATAPLRGIIDVIKAATGAEEKQHAKGEHEAHEHARAFGVLSTHVRLLRGHFVSLGGTIGEIGDKFSEFLPMFAGIGAAGGLAGLVEMTEHASEVFSELQRSATAAGVATQQFAELATVAKMTDIPIDTMQNGLFRLNRVIGDTAAGKNKEAAALFAHLGISVRGANGHLRSATDIMPQLADAFAHTTDPALRARMAMVLFSREGLNLIPLLAQGKEKLEEYQKAAASVVYVPKGADAAGLESFHEVWVELTTAVQGFTMEIGAKLAPVLQPVIDMAKDWVVQNRAWIASDIVGAVKDLATALEEMPLKSIADHVREVVHVVGEVIDFFGGWKFVVGAAAVMMSGPLLSALVSVIDLVEGVTTVLKAAGALAWANPIVAGAMAAAVVAYEVYEHWAWVKKEMAAIWHWFEGQSTWARVIRDSIAPFTYLPREIIAHWKPLTAFFESLWSGITGTFDAVWAHIAPIAHEIGDAVSSIEHSWVGRHLLGGDAAPGAATRPVASLPPSPYAPGSAAARAAVGASGTRGAAGQNGHVETIVTLRGLPPGSRVETRTAGHPGPVKTNVGYADPMAYGF